MAGIEGLVKVAELRKRILFTLMMLAVYRLGVHIPTPGVDGAALQQIFTNLKGTVFGWFNLFSGGALERFSIFALGVMPYISSSIIFQLLTVVWPYLHELQKEGEQGRKKITQYTRYGTVLLSLVQGFGIASGLQTQPGVVLEPGTSFVVMTMLTLTAGTVFLMWLGEQISERGIGNGISLIIYAGIIAELPSALYQLGQKTVDDPENFGPTTLAVLLIMSIIVIAFIIMMERGQRRITVQYAKRVVGRRMFGGNANYLPLRINSAGVIPPIFASSILMF